MTLTTFDRIIRDRGSVYAVSGGPVADRAAIEAGLSALTAQRRFAKATHNSWAARLGGEGLKADDGEAGAGAIILRMLETEGLDDHLIVVTRWYGGKHLGGDRFRHVIGAVVYTLARTRGSANGIRLVLVGIGVAATVSAVLDFMLLTSELSLATQVQDWRAGSLSGRGWEHARSVFLAAAVLLPGLAALRRAVDTIELGDSAAYGLGVPVERTRLAAIILATLAACIATAVAGPIAFIALAGPHIARFITRIPGVTILHSFITGAVLLLLADHATQHIDIGLRTPVGLVTGVLGGGYLLLLLTRPNTRT